MAAPAPTDDPFSPLFSGPFQGIPTRLLPTDTLTYTLHLLPATPAALETLLTSALALAASWSKDYIWQRTPFTLSLSADGTHLHGSLEYGDAIDDEWFAVAILTEASRRNPDAWIRVSDGDGEFLLVEAAHALPRWLNPEVAGHRVWVRQGRVWIIPRTPAGPREISLEAALEFLAACEMESLVRDVGVEREALQRTRAYPEAAWRHLHRAMVVVPRRVAAVLRWRKETVAAAVEAFYVRDPVSLVALKRKERRVPWEDTVEMSVVFTKVLFAQLKGQVWAPPKEAGFPMEGDTKVDVGVKVTAGFEMLLASENDVLLTSDYRRSMVDDTRTFLDAGETLPTDAEIAGWGNEEDGEEWLNIDFNEFEKDLKGAGGGVTEGAYGDPEQEEKLKRMVERFEAFLNDDTAGLDGAEFRDEMDDDDDEEEEEEEEELNSDDDISDDDDEGEDKAVSFDEEEFERMMRQMMGLPPDEEAGEEKDIKRIQDQIERELTEAGAIERETPRIRELSGDEGEEEEGQGEVNIDYTLAKNLLESFKGQGGLSGPGGNLLARMGVALPRDESEETAEALEGKGRGATR